MNYKNSLVDWFGVMVEKPAPSPSGSSSQRFWVPHPTINVALKDEELGST